MNNISLKESFLDKAMEIATGQGINCEPSGIAGLALIFKCKINYRRIKRC